MIAERHTAGVTARDGIWWFEYGRRLEEEGRMGDAATAFLTAYDLDPEDGGLLYRACIALALAGETARLLETLHRECARDPYTFVLVTREPAFADYLHSEEFAGLWELYEADCVVDTTGRCVLVGRGGCC